MTQPSQGERRDGFRLLVHGASGRFGKVIVEIARSQSDLTVKGAGRADPIEQLVTSADVVIDVTAPAATTAVARLCSENQKPLIVGTTRNKSKLCTWPPGTLPFSWPQTSASGSIFYCGWPKPLRPSWVKISMWK